MAFTTLLSVIAIILSAFAFFTTYRKDAHRIRIELHRQKYNNIVLGIVNDGGIDIIVRSIGHFKWFGKVTWIVDSVGNNSENTAVALPLAVKARSTFEVFIHTRHKIPEYDGTHGFCLQLDTGRIFICSPNIAQIDAIRMHMTSWISRVSGGKYAPGIERPRFKKY